MANKTQNIYICSNCDAQSPKWSGRCLECGSWGTLVQSAVKEKDKAAKNLGLKPAEIMNLNQIEDKNLPRLKTNFSEIDRVLGGGLVPGSLIILAGEPGIGKSTLVAQIAQAVDRQVIYISGEESPAQIKMRFARLGIKSEKINLISETEIESIKPAIINAKPGLVIIDSIQTVYSALVPAEPGNISQIRTVTMELLETAKKYDITIIIIGHITKDGNIAGPKSLEHIVDTVIYLDFDTSNNYRILRTVKNRFGATNELGILEMSGGGFREVKDPSGIFMDENEAKISGSAISCLIEGSRPFLLEIQALVTKTVFGYPLRKSSGFDLNRLQVLAAVLSKRTKINLTNQDIILNIVGGLKTNDPGLDLAVCLAIASSLLDINIDKKTLILGEIGLGGEVRNIFRLEDRLKEAKKLGFTKAIIPDVKINSDKLELKKVKNILEAIKYINE